MFLVAYFFIVFIGLLQFILGFFGIHFYVMQCWIADVLPRINGFSYEPSFYATYLFPGWVICAYLLEKKIFPVKSIFMKMGFILISLALLLCSSRIGWLFMGLWAMRWVYVVLRRCLSMYVARPTFKVIFCLILCALAVIVFIGSQNFTPQLFFQGTGLADTSRHSVTIRSKELSDTWEAFFGHSMGGISTVIAQLNGADFTTMEQLKHYEGLSVAVQILASNGLIGSLPFWFFLGIIFIKSYGLILRSCSVESRLLAASLIALSCQFLMLQVNQHILRPYFWLNVAYLLASYHVVKSQYRLS